MMTRKSIKLLAWALALQPAFASPPKLDVYIGTFTQPGASEGIYRAVFDPASGRVELAGLAIKADNPSFLTVAADGKTLYAATGNGVACYHIKADGGLEEIGRQSHGKGQGTCHVRLHPSGSHLFAASYEGGSIAAYPIDASGSLGAHTDFIVHQDPRAGGKVKVPFAHSVYPLGDHVYACDTGVDEIFIYKFDEKAGKLTPNDPPRAEVNPGGSPRHLAITPDQRFAYACNEANSTVTALRHDSAKGRLDPFQVISTLPADHAAGAVNNTAEIGCSENGRFLYVTNRGHDSIAIYQIDPESGNLTLIDNADSRVKSPWAFAILPGGKWMIVAGKASNSIAVHAMDPANGRLSFSGVLNDVPSPTSIVLVGVNPN